jgi:hypothetical protein
MSGPRPIGSCPRRTRAGSSAGRWPLIAVVIAACGGRAEGPGRAETAEPPANDGATAETEAPDLAAPPDAPASDRDGVDLDTAAPHVEPDVEPDVVPDAELDTNAPDLVPAPPAGGCGTARGDGWLAVPEASGAVRLATGELLVVADSGHAGAALLIDPTGEALGVAVRLPLDGPRHPETGLPTDDDLEGLDLLPDGRLVGLTSAGWLRVWARGDDAFVADGPSRAISDDPRFACESRAVNCGPNYEGLCLRPSPSPGRCDGYAASKASGELVCLVVGEDGALVVDPDRALQTGVPVDELSDCAFIPGSGADGSAELLLAGNLYSGSAIWRFDEATGALTRTDVVGAGNQEAIVHLGDGRWWSLGDLQGLSAESPWQAFDCR